eukprot:6492078-Amphidinium_carterae.1
MNISVPQEPAAKRHKGEVDPLRDGMQALEQKLLKEIGGMKQAMQQAIGGIESTIDQKLAPLVTLNLLCPLKDEESATTAWDERAAQFHKDMMAHYQSPCVGEYPSCMVLSSLFPEMSTAAGSWPNKIAAVAEHIYPKSASHSADSYWSLKVWDPRNGIFLLKDLELKFQSGKWSLIPMDSRIDIEGQQWYSFQIHVCNDLMHVPITYYKKGVPVGKRTPVRVERQPLLYRRLHLQVIYLRNKPFLRSLWAKAYAAHLRHNELPNPAEMMERFRLCPQVETLTQVFMQKLQDCPQQVLTQEEAFAGDS